MGVLFGILQLKDMAENIRETISQEAMREAIARSGYLLEQRIKPKIERQGYFVETNQAYPDPQTGVSREYDISAMGGVRLFRGRYDFLFPCILCECENNSIPVVFFETVSPITFLFHMDVKCSGVPVKLWKNGEWVPISFELGFEKFHHYCRGKIATQYCSFVKKGDRWIATHLDPQHQTLNKLVDALEAIITEHYNSWRLPTKGEKEPINIQLYYPLLVVQGDLYLAKQSRRGLKMRKVRHVQFRRELWSAQKKATYHIDVIHESFLSAYLKIVEKEVEAVKRRFVKRRKSVQKSIDKLILEARQQRRSNTPFRKIFEGESGFSTS
jgi:hypothetical protein